MNFTKRLTLAAMFLALGLILPFLTGQIQGIGNKLLPMHIPVLLCGVVCGWRFGLLIGGITPLLRCLLFGMPIFTNAMAMAFELAVYGAVIGLLYYHFKKARGRIYISLVTAMIAGRVIWGVANIIIYQISGTVFTWNLFIGGALLQAIPGLILQLILIPLLIVSLEKAGVIKHA